MFCVCLFRWQEEVPPNVYYAHYKNVEKSVVNGKFDPTAGLSSSGIAGTGPDKEEDDAATNKSANADEEMKDISKKDGGKHIRMKFQLMKRTAHLLYWLETTTTAPNPQNTFYSFIFIFILR